MYLLEPTLIKKKFPILKYPLGSRYYKTVILDNYKLSVEFPNNYCKITSIRENENTICFEAFMIQNLSDFFSEPFKSSLINIYFTNCESISSEPVKLTISEISSKIIKI